MLLARPTPGGSVVLADVAAGRGQCSGGRAHAGGGVHSGGPRQHDGVRVFRAWHQSAPWHAGKSLGPAVQAHSRRQFVRHRGGGLGRDGGGGTWAPIPAGRAASRRHSAVLWATNLPLRRVPVTGRAAAGAVTGFGGAAGTQRCLLRRD